MIINIIGCGLSGITAAALLKNKGHKIQIFEQRSHIGGNCYDSNLAGTLVHNYGPHLFHTNDDDVFNFLSKYTEWFPYYNRPKGNTKLGLVSLPYSKKTINELNRELTQEEIFDVIFKDYSEKQWGVPFDVISKSILNRIPKTKDSENPTWYEGEKYQFLPKEGYTKMMERMLEGILVEVNVSPTEWKKYPSDLTIFTGKIDEYYDYVYGELPYRTLEFEHLFTSKKLEHAIINQNMSSIPYTRMYDHSFFNYKHNGSTIITKEFSKQCTKQDVPFYPITFGKGLKTYNLYKQLADKESNVLFLGRLATYTYLDMWMAIKQSMLKCAKI
jgi:UDP-galactopyranose mutase